MAKNIKPKKRKIYVVCARGPEWNNIVKAYEHKCAADAEAERLKIEGESSNDIFDKYSEYVVEEIILN